MELVTLASVILVAATIITGVVLSITKRFRITWLLSGSFVLIFLIQAILEPDLLRQGINFSFMFMGSGEFLPFHYDLGFSLYYFLELPSERWFTIVTALFTHSNLLHLFLNTIFMLLIGLPLEKKIGRSKFLILFLLAGVLGSLISGVLGYVEFYSISKYSFGIGASGALFGIMGCYFYLYPNDKVWFFMNLPVWAFVLIYFLMNVVFFVLLRSNLTDDRAYISYEGHIAGLIGGIIMGVIYRYVSKIPRTPKEEKPLDTAKLKELATTKRLRDILKKIETEDEPDIQKIWLEEFAGNVKCPECGNKDMALAGSKFKCACKNSISLKN